MITRIANALMPLATGAMGFMVLGFDSLDMPYQSAFCIAGILLISYVNQQFNATKG